VSSRVAVFSTLLAFIVLPLSMVAALAVCAHYCLWGIGVSSTFTINLYNDSITIIAAFCKILVGNIARHNGLDCKGCTESGEVSRVPEAETAQPFLQHLSTTFIHNQRQSVDKDPAVGRVCGQSATRSGVAGDGHPPLKKRAWGSVMYPPKIYLLK